ncbi:unnamed protein product [Ectocarpus sp. 13 AM-2016]
MDLTVPRLHSTGPNRLLQRYFALDSGADSSFVSAHACTSWEFVRWTIDMDPLCSPSPTVWWCMVLIISLIRIALMLDPSQRCSNGLPVGLCGPHCACCNAIVSCARVSRCPPVLVIGPLRHLVFCSFVSLRVRVGTHRNDSQQAGSLDRL